MTKTMEELYEMLDARVRIEENRREQFQALAKARMAVLHEIEQESGGECVALWDALSSLEGQSEDLRRQALFQEALALGMELGRLRA